MGEAGKTFTVASDATIVPLIESATNRLVVVAPALSDQVALALAARFRDEGNVQICVVLDADPEVYRLGYGTEKALTEVRKAADEHHIDLRMQPGVRIGLVIADDVTLVFAPVPQLIEAGSTSAQKPNAIMLSGAAAPAITQKIADASGLSSSVDSMVREIGTQALTPEKAETVRKDLAANPPQPFNVARAMRVFSSKVQFVEVDASGYRLSKRAVSLPADLLGFKDEKLRRQIEGRLRPFDDIDVGMTEQVPDENGKTRQVTIDENFIKERLESIKKKYLYHVDNFGSLVFRNSRDKFETEIDDLRKSISAYHQRFSSMVEGKKNAIKTSIVEQCLPVWKASPPEKFSQQGVEPTDSNMRCELEAQIDRHLAKALQLEKPGIRLVYKNVAAESVSEASFIDPLRREMAKRGILQQVIDDLFVSTDAAPTVPGPRT